jgi:hypothetical protein
MSASHEVDETFLWIRRNETDAEPVANVDCSGIPKQFTFDWWMRHTNPSSVIGGSGNDRVEYLSDLGLKKDRGCALLHQPLYFVRSVFSFRAVRGERPEFLF